MQTGAPLVRLPPGTATFNEPGMLLLPCASGAAEASDSKGSWEKRENTNT